MSLAAKPRANNPSHGTAAHSLAHMPIGTRRSDKLDLRTVERKSRREPAPRLHTGGIKEAPTFRPTEDEWKSPMTYIQGIAEEGSRYGIVKIIPPDGWNPDFAIDTEVFRAPALSIFFCGNRADTQQRFHFKTRKQELNHVEGGEPFPCPDSVWTLMSLQHRHSCKQ